VHISPEMVLKTEVKKMNTNYISKFFTGAIFSSILLLVLLGISALGVNAQTLVLGTPNCEKLNGMNSTFPTITSNYGFKLEGAPSGTFTFTNADGELTGGAPSDPDNSVTTVVTNGKILNWGATKGIRAVIIKGGPNANVYVYNPTATSGGPLNAPSNKDIIHIEFCFEEGLTPTAATAMVAGRILTDNNGSLRRSVSVTILNTRTLETQTVMANRLGYYQFDDLQVGDTYVITVRSKGYTFTPQTISLSEDSSLDMFGSVSESPRTKGRRIF
jgi:hypothetical protein